MFAKSTLVMPEQTLTRSLLLYKTAQPPALSLGPESTVRMLVEAHAIDRTKTAHQMDVRYNQSSESITSTN